MCGGRRGRAGEEGGHAGEDRAGGAGRLGGRTGGESLYSQHHGGAEWRPGATD